MLIELNGMQFHAYHGCLPSERIIGNRFVVDVKMHTHPLDGEQSDRLCDTVDYATVYDAVKDEMSQPSNLLEHLARRMADRIMELDRRILRVTVRVAKMSPPLPGETLSTAVSLTRSRSRTQR